MAEIRLPCGLIALVDDEDLPRVAQLRWHAHKKSNTTYVVHRPLLPNGKKSRLLLHRFILRMHTGVKVDHWNGNGLDNQKHNLRPATSVQNSRNRRPLLGCASNFKGVFRHRDKWHAVIYTDSGRLHLGTFACQEAAALAYDEAARKRFGEFAYLNFSTSGEANVA